MPAAWAAPRAELGIPMTLPGGTGVTCQTCECSGPHFLPLLVWGL